MKTAVYKKKLCEFFNQPNETEKFNIINNVQKKFVYIYFFLEITSRGKQT